MGVYWTLAYRLFLPKLIIDPTSLFVSSHKKFVNNVTRRTLMHDKTKEKDSVAMIPTDRGVEDTYVRLGCDLRSACKLPVNC